MKKRILTFMAVIVLSAVMTSQVVFAYFSKSIGETDNKINTGKVSIILDEPGFDGKIINSKAQKAPVVTNNGTTSCWVRARIVYNPEFVSGFDGVAQNGNWGDQINPGEFVYYNVQLKPGEKTPPIFTGVNFNEAKINSLKDENGVVSEEKLKLLNVGVYVEAVNAEAGATAKAAFNAVKAQK